MSAEIQNPGLAPRASRNQLGGCLHTSLTALDRQAQLLAVHFYLSPSMARVMAGHCYGERCYD